MCQFACRGSQALWYPAVYQMFLLLRSAVCCRGADRCGWWEGSLPGCRRKLSPPGKSQAQAVSEYLSSVCLPCVCILPFPPLARCAPGGISWTSSFAEVHCVRELSQGFPCITSWTTLLLFMQIKHVKCNYRFLSIHGILTSAWICGILEISSHTWTNPWEFCNEPALGIFKLMPRSNSCWMFFHFPLSRWSHLVGIGDWLHMKWMYFWHEFLSNFLLHIFLFEDMRSNLDIALPSLLMW